jgi:hypothetical protein
MFIGRLQIGEQYLKSSEITRRLADSRVKKANPDSPAAGKERWDSPCVSGPSKNLRQELVILTGFLKKSRENFHERLAKLAFAEARKKSDSGHAGTHASAMQ